MKGLARGSSASIACFVSLELSKIATVVATEKETKGTVRTDYKQVVHAISSGYDTAGTEKKPREGRLA
jgi:mevalonate kinase